MNKNKSFYESFKRIAFAFCAVLLSAVLPVFADSPNMISAHPASSWTKNGITVTTTGNGIYTVNGTATENTEIKIPISQMTIPLSIIKGGPGSLYIGNSSIVSGGILGFSNGDTMVDTWGLSEVRRYNKTYSAMGLKVIDGFYLWLVSGTTLTNFTFSPAIYNDSRTEPGNFVAGSVMCPNGETLQTRHQSGLPLGYTLLDYIESTGTQYINTGITSNGVGLKSEVKLQLTTDSIAEQAIIGRNAGSGYELGFTSGARIFTYHYTDQAAKQDINYNTSTIYTLISEMTENSITQSVNGVAAPSYSGVVDTSSSYTQSAEISLFRHNFKYPMSAKVYYIKLWNNGSLVRDFVPAKNASNVVGMYDLVSGQFFTNAGTGTFTAGAPVSDPETTFCASTGGIKIATTKYNEDAFANLVTTLNSAITKVTNIVDTTVAQATSIGTLATTKQDRPADGDCPAGRKCLLVTGTDGKPHWYLIQE